MTRRERLQLFVTWLLLGLLPILIRPLWEPDEGRYAEIPREMLASGDWLTPRLNGVLYFEKPPLQYWLSALSMKTFGLHAFAARLPLALAWGISMVCAWRLARRLGARQPMRAVVMAGTTLLGFITGQILTLDALFTAFVLLSLTAALEAVTATWEGRPNLGWTLLFFAALAFGMLTKGLAAPVLAGGVFLLILPLAWPDQKLRSAVLTTGFHPLGWGLFATLAAPWFWLVDSANPGHASFFFIHEHFTRFSSHAHSRQGSNNPVLDKFYFVLVLGAGLLPWLSTGFQGLKGAFQFVRKAVDPESHRTPLRRWTVAAVLAGAAWPFLFFTFSGSKLPPYVLPSVVPIMALACAFGPDLEARDSRRWMGMEILILGIVFLAATVAFRKEVGAVGWIVATGVAFVCLGVWTRSNKAFPTHRWMFALTGCFLLLTYAGHRSVSKSKDVRPLVALAPNDAQWISYGVYFQGLPFHARQRVAVVAGTGELAFGRDHLTLDLRDRWFQETNTGLLPFALRMREEAPSRPVMVLAKRKTWAKVDDATREAFSAVAESGGMTLLQLK